MIKLFESFIYFIKAVNMGKASLQCLICAKGILNLSKHMTYHNIKQENWKQFCIESSPVKKVYKCESTFCNYTTNDKSNLNKHKRFIHSSENTVSCDKCPKTFKCRSGLNIHINSKHKNQVFQCDECLTTFIQMKSFKTHMTNKHNGLFTSDTIIVAYKCDVCCKYFSYMKKVHICTTEMEKRFTLVKGYRQYPMNNEEINKRKKIMVEENQDDLRVNLIEPLQVNNIPQEDDLQEPLTLNENPQQVYDEDELIEETEGDLRVIKNPQQAFDKDDLNNDMQEDDLQETLTVNKNPQQVYDKDELIGRVQVNKNQQEVIDELSDWYTMPENCNILIKIELEDNHCEDIELEDMHCEAIEINSSRSKGGAKVVLPKDS